MQDRLRDTQVKSTPEKQKYIRNNLFWEYTGKATLRRLSWGAACLLSCMAIVPLAFKCIVNLIDTIFNHDSYKEALKNLGGMLAFPLIAGVSSSISILPIPEAIPYAPSRLGKTLTKALMLPIHFLYKNSTGDLKEEVGPRKPTGQQAAIIHIPGLGRFASILPLNHSYPEVKGLECTIDTVDIPANHLTPRCRLVFNASAEIYQLNFEKYQKENTLLNCNTRAFNYPGITKEDELNSMNDLVNAGIAEVYDLAKSKNWTNAEIEKNLHFYGYCFGGGIALQVAAYFKKRHHVDIPVFIDRSYASLDTVSAKLIRAYTGLPEWYAKLLSKAFLYASDDMNIDSLAAVKKLNPACVNYVNLDYLTPPSKASTFIKKIKKFFGIGRYEESADAIIQEGAALADGIEATQLAYGRKTSDIYTYLSKADKHRFYSDNSDLNGHFKTLDRIYPDKSLGINRGTALDYYVNVMKPMPEEKIVATNSVKYPG